MVTSDKALRTAGLAALSAFFLLLIGLPLLLGILPSQGLALFEALHGIALIAEPIAAAWLAIALVGFAK